MDGHLKYGLLMGLYSSALLAMPITVLANTDMQNATDLPQIVSWDDGHGYLESGEMLRNGWGYDTVNPDIHVRHPRIQISGKWRNASEWLGL